MRFFKAQPAPEPRKSIAMDYRQMANAIRALSMDAVEKANSGHPGMPMGIADVATVLFAKYLKFDASEPRWPDRDRFILSAGHGSMLQYALLYLTGNNLMTLDQLKNFRQLHSLTPGHPEVMPDAGIETTTGPLGQGISTAVGFALAERILNNRFTDDLVDHRTFVIASDGDLMEGISHEACALAGHLKLSRLIVLYDDNGISIDGPTSLSYSDNVPKRFESYGWDVQTVDGHNFEQIDAAIAKAMLTKTPSMICCKTHIGYGAPTKQDSASSHGSPLGAQEIAGAREKLAWPHAPFEIPADVLDMWRAVGTRGEYDRREWEGRLNANRLHGEFMKNLDGDVSTAIAPLVAKIKAKFASEKPKLATRQTSGIVLEELVAALPNLIGGSADLTGSNLTKTKGPEALSPGKYNGQYIHYGVREHGMAAIMNGMALHGGVIPYSGTFLSFADYSRPAIRLGALMKQRVVHVMTHDSIGLGEDGPTHQPVEHLASLRAIPNLLTMRPCDGVETAECWEIALNRMTGPSLLALTRQGLPTYRATDAENFCAYGAYILADCHNPKVTIFASGSEVEIAMNAKKMLDESGMPTRVVSVPCMELFAAQDESYREAILGGPSIKVAVEAGIRQGWDALIGRDGIFVGMKTFGESAPYQKLYEHFGITPQGIVEAVKARNGINAK
jgi:transketolase